MPRIYSYHQVVLSDEVYTIPDDDFVFLEDPQPEETDDRLLDADGFAPLQDWEPERFSEPPDMEQDDEHHNDAISHAEELAQDILQKAREEAALIVSQANLQAKLDHDHLLAQTATELEQIKKEAYEEAYQAGRTDGAQAEAVSIRECIGALEIAVANLEGQQAGFMAEYEYNLKWLAWEIASKVLGHKIEQDETELVSLVKTAVASVKNAKWIAVEVSEEMTELIDRLTQEFKRTGDAQIDIRGISAPVGTCIVDTPDGLIDASVYSQLENLRQYFMSEE